MFIYIVNNVNVSFKIYKAFRHFILDIIIRIINMFLGYLILNYLVEIKLYNIIIRPQVIYSAIHVYTLHD